jgi:RNA polymerase sigma factor (sigma-70 family)
MSATTVTLSLEQEQALGYRIREGDESAANELVEANLRFAMYMANRYRREGVDVDDLIQEANIGLMLAARHYDPDRGVRFTSYAGWWIEAQLRRFLSRYSSVLRVGETTQQVARQLRRVEEKLLQEHDHVTIEMVAAEAGIALETARFALGTASATPLSLDRAMGDVEGEFTLQDMVADESTDREFAQAEVETILEPLLDNLDARQRQILQMRYGENRTCNDIGDELGLSGSRVQQIEVQAIRSLRRRLMMPRAGVQAA